MGIPYISLGVIAGGIYLISTGRSATGIILIVIIILIQIIIQIIKNGGFDGYKGNV